MYYTWHGSNCKSHALLFAKNNEILINCDSSLLDKIETLLTKF